MLCVGVFDDIAGVNLDYSPESLQYLDTTIDDWRAKAYTVNPRVIACLGAYLGEVLVEQFGGRWVLDCDNQLFVWLDSGVFCDPLGKCERSITTGEESLMDYYRRLSKSLEKGEE